MKIYLKNCVTFGKLSQDNSEEGREKWQANKRMQKEGKPSWWTDLLGKDWSAVAWYLHCGSLFS